MMYPKQEKVDVMEVCGVDEQENRKSTGFDALGTTVMTSTDDQRGIWEIDVRAQQQNLLHEMNDPSMFYNDQFPHIPDFPCMSSSSSSSSNPAPAKPISSATTTSSASSASSSTSSAASWAVLKSEYVTEEEAEGEDRLMELRINRKKRSHREEPAPVMSTAVVEAVPALEKADGSGAIDCMDVMENFGYMDLIDGNEIWDPSSIFEQNPPDLQQECVTARGYSNGSEVVQESERKDGGREGGGGRLDELGVMFFDWLKSNKEFISAEDMRNIKLKKSTVECASKRLGSSKEGKKQLLKLILEWVQQHQLQRKNSGAGELPAAAAATTTTTTQYPLQHYQGLPPPPPPPPQTSATPPPPFNCNSWVPPSDMNHGFSPPPWIPPPVAYPSYMADQASNGMGMVAAVPQATFSYMGDGSDQYNSGLNCINPYNNPGSGEYQVLESAPSWNPSQITMAASPYNNQFPDVGNNYGPQIMPLASGYPDQYPYNPQVYAAGGCGEQRLMRLGSSATKEARKKRMARQRRTYFHHHHHHSRQNQHNHQNHMANSDHHPHAMLVDENCSGKSHGGNWVYWPSPASTNTVPPPPPPMESPHRPPSRPQQAGDRQSKQTPLDKRQGLKTEKNLKFLLQKVLKQSDVGSLGRIVLPKKEAESHLPDLDTRDGISIAMEDIGTSQVWNMRYRFWPNNKSRMYLLENTGDFVKANGLQEGDFIVLYSDVKCGKYLIRGVKVRQPASGKSEGKKPFVKRSYRSTSQSARSSPSSPAKITAI